MHIADLALSDNEVLKALSLKPPPASIGEILVNALQNGFKHAIKGVKQIRNFYKKH
jgi:hypothetical protein